MVSQSIGYGIHLDWNFSVGFAGNDWSASAFSDGIADVITVVTAIGEKHFGIGKISIDQGVKAFEIRNFTACYFSSNREIVSVGDEVDLGPKATL